MWDIVDKGKSRKKASGLKLTNEPSEESANNLMDSCLDAEFLNVYQGTHAVIFMFDISKKWTYDYVIQNLPLVPHEIPVLVMANFMDNQENRVVGETTGMKSIHSAARRPLAAAPVVVIESSLKDGFGLKMVHQFFNLPFLSLQRKSLQQMLETNKQNQTKVNEFFLNSSSGKDERDYGLFLQKIDERRSGRISASSPEKVLSPTSVSQTGSPSKKSSEQSKSAAEESSATGFGFNITKMFSKRSKQKQEPSKAVEPSGDNLDSFLDDRGSNAVDGRQGPDVENSEDEDHNPMVDNFNEDFLSDENIFMEEVLGEPKTESSKKNKQRTISSSSDEDVRSRQPAKEPEFATNYTSEPDIIFVTADFSPEMNLNTNKMIGSSAENNSFNLGNSVENVNEEVSEDEKSEGHSTTTSEGGDVVPSDEEYSLSSDTGEVQLQSNCKCNLMTLLALSIVF